MGEGLRADITTRLFLQAVIAYGRGRSEAFFNVPALKDVARAIGVVGPHAGKAIGLQFKSHR